jgi:hypothetical protein
MELVKTAWAGQVIKLVIPPTPAIVARQKVEV